MKRKVTCFTSMALAVLMAVSPVVGSSVSVFAAEPSDDTAAIQVTPSKEDVSDEIVVEADSDAIEIKKEMQAAVKIGDAGESDIEVETEYQAGDSIPVHVTAENPTDKAADFRLYFWDYGESLPEDKGEWSEVLTDACEDVKIAELQDADEYAVDLKQGEDTVQSKVSFVSDEDDKDQLTAAYLSMEIPSGASLDTVFHISSDVAETVTVIPVFGAESENAFYGDAAVAQWKENPIVVEADQSEDTAETEPETEDADAIVVETEEPTDSFLSIYVGDSSAETETEEDASVTVTPDTADLNASDFASMRLVVLADDASVITNDSDVIGQYGNVYLLQFTSIQQAMNAYTYYKDKVTAVEPDMVVKTASDVQNEDTVDVLTPDISMTEVDNPVSLLNELDVSEEIKSEHRVIALIDTSVKEHENVVDRVSVVDDGSKETAHGDAMVEAIVSQDADADILSICAIGDNGLGTISSLIAAIEYAIAQDVDSINLSLGTKSTLMTSVLKEEILKATDAGILVVGAAGNSSADVVDYIPGSVEEAYVIGAADEEGVRQKFSNFGETVDYNVVADSTSEAAALFTGFVSANGLDAVEGVLNQGLIYTSVPVSLNKVSDERVLEGEATEDWIGPYSSGLTKEQLKALGLTEVEWNELWESVQDQVGLMEESSTEWNGGISLFSTSNGQPDKTVHIVKGGQIHYGSWFTHRFTADGRTAFCAEPNVTSPNTGTYQAYRIDNNNLLRTAILCAPGGPLDGRITGFPYGSIYYDTNPSVVDGNRYQNAHATIGYIYTGSLAGLSASYAQGIRNMATLVGNVANNTGGGWGAGYGVDLSQYECYIAINGAQDIVWCEENPKGKLSMKKESALPDITNGNACYSLAGAKYGVYANAACTDLKATLTTGADGSSNSVELTAGNYWCKEISPSQGYELDPTVYPVTISSGSSTSFTSKEPPGNDPMGISIEKTWTGEKTDTVPSLEGAQFTVEYYDNMDKNVSGTPKRTWVIEIKKVKDIYMAALDDEYLVEGSDPLYKSEKGNTILPYGTYKIWESKAAPDYDIEGTLMNVEGTMSMDITKPFITVVDKDTTGNINLRGGNAYKGFDETVPLSITIKKFDESDKPLEGVTFKIQSKSGYAETQSGWKGEVTTGKDGIAKWTNLYPDVYTITEVKTPDGKNLLRDPIVVELPGKMTQADAKKYNLKDPDPNDKYDGVVWDEYAQVYYINDPVFEVGNDVTFKMPMSGGLTTPMTFVPLIAGMGILGGLGVVGFRKKRKK